MTAPQPAQKCCDWLPLLPGTVSGWSDSAASHSTPSLLWADGDWQQAAGVLKNWTNSKVDGHFPPNSIHGLFPSDLPPLLPSTAAPSWSLPTLLSCCQFPLLTWRLVYCTAPRPPCVEV
jgi:hypothetical protein